MLTIYQLTHFDLQSHHGCNLLNCKCNLGNKLAFLKSLSGTEFSPLRGPSISPAPHVLFFSFASGFSSLLILQVNQIILSVDASALMNNIFNLYLSEHNCSLPQMPCSAFTHLGAAKYNNLLAAEQFGVS